MLGNRKEYSKYYGNFRGVDFSSDHTQVNDQRFAYAVNMYKDYQSGQGQCIETIPGFRRRVEGLPAEKIWGIHQINVNENGEWRRKVLVHCGTRLYSWDYEDNHSSPGVLQKKSVTLGDPESEIDGFKTFNVEIGKFKTDQYRVADVFLQDGTVIVDALIESQYENEVLTAVIESSELEKGDVVQIWYSLNGISYFNTIELPACKSISVVFNNRLHIFCGGKYFVYDGTDFVDVMGEAYIPTTYINTISSGENADAGTQKENRNMLSPLFKHSFYGDGSTVSFDLNESGATVEKVEVYGVKAQEVSFESYSHGDGSSGFGIRYYFTADNVTYYSTDDGVTWHYDDGDGGSVQTATFNKGLFFYYVRELAYISGISFLQPPPEPLDAGYPEGYAGIEITAKKQWYENDGETLIEESILNCTMACVFKNHVMLSGNPRYPNRVFWSALNNPAYFPVVNFKDLGVGDAPITGMIPIADALMVLKGDTQQDGSVYFLTPVETGDDLAPIIFTSVPGLSGTGCLGACVNFLDDPVFISRLGLEAMGQLSVRLERAIEHRSSLVDAKLTTMDLSRASMIEWNGYLVILIDGKIFMADSRQRYTDETGVLQYEWYYLEDIGVWDGQYVEYRYASSMRRDMYLEDGETPRYIVKYCKNCGQSGICDRKNASSFTIDGCGCGEHTTNWIDLDLKLSDKLGGEVVNPPDEDGKETATVNFTRLMTDAGYEIDLFYHIKEIESPYEYGKIDGYQALLCTTRENYTGGVFVPATTLAVIDNNLFFGTENGIICSFNFDMRNEFGEIPKEYYTFDNRAIFCGVATKMDNCGIPHLTKNTVKKSTVIKTRTMQTSGAKVKVRTNRKPYEQIARISSGQFFFDNVDFSDFSFVTTEHNLFAVREKEKKWVEKQYFLYSDEYMKPFSLFYIAYRYHVVGRYKEPK